jgi:hypothetical protein
LRSASGAIQESGVVSPESCAGVGRAIIFSDVYTPLGLNFSAVVAFIS